LGQVGMEWTVSGFGDFSSNPRETDMLMRDSNNGVFVVYDIKNNVDRAGTTPPVASEKAGGEKNG
jgi:hypothetical protein